MIMDVLWKIVKDKIKTRKKVGVKLEFIKQEEELYVRIPATWYRDHKELFKDFPKVERISGVVLKC